MTRNKKQYKLSIIILSWNTKQLLQNCLESIFAAESKRPKAKGFNYEIIVVDNASTDGSKKYLKSLESKGLGYRKKPNSKPPNPILFKVIFNDRNLGFAKGNNQGIKQAKGKYILLLNSDTEIKPGAVQALVSYLEQNPDTTAVSPMLLNMDGSKQIDYYMRFPNFWQMVFYHNGILRPIAMHTPLKYLLINQQKEKPFPVDQLPGAALMTSKQTFNQIGLLDENFDFLFEDVDWCYRAKKEHNGKLMVVPQAEIMHVGGASWKQKLDKNRVGFYKLYFKSLFKFVNKHYPYKKLLLKLGLTFSLLTNAFAHTVTLRLKKTVTQLKLIKTIINDF